jgi:hypothetical protein
MRTACERNGRIAAAVLAVLGSAGGGGRAAVLDPQIDVFEVFDELKRLSRGHRISDGTIHDMQRDHCGSR